MALAGKSASVKITATVPTTALAETFTAVAGSSVAYQIDDTTMRHWERNPNTTTRPRMLWGGSTAGVSSYTVNHVQGIVTFASTTATAVTGDVEYLTASAVAQGREWSLNVDRDMFEVSTFQSGGWREFQQNVNGAQVSIGRYFIGPGSTSASEIFDRLNVDQDLIVELLPSDSAGDRYEGYAFITSDQIEASVDGIVGENFDLTIDGTLYYTTSP